MDGQLLTCSSSPDVCLSAPNKEVGGTTKPSSKNQPQFDAAVAKISRITRQLVDSLETAAPPRNREVEATKARARATRRYG